MASQAAGQEQMPPSPALFAAGSASSGASASTAASSQSSPKKASKVNSDIDRLLDAQKKLKQDKKDLQNELRNAQRRRKRLKHKARLLNACDLLEVMQLRQDDGTMMKMQKMAPPEEPPALGSDEEVGSERGDLDEPEQEKS